MNFEITHLVFIYAEELLHWSVRTEKEREIDRNTFTSTLCDCCDYES